MKGKLARNSLGTAAMLGLRLATQATVLVLLTRLLGPGFYGSYAALASLVVILGVLPNLGAGFVMLARGRHGTAGIADVWRYAWPTIVALGTLLIVVYVLAARHLTDPSIPYATLLVLGLTELLLTPFTQLLTFALQARELVPLSQCVQWIPLGLRVPAALMCFEVPEIHRLSAYVFLQMGSSLAGVAIGTWITGHFVKLDWRPRLATGREIREGVSYALMNLVAANPTELDKVLALRMVGPQPAGIYAATSRVMSVSVLPVTAMLLSALPRLFRHAGQPTQAGHRLIGIIALLSILWGVASGGLILLCSPVLPWLLGASFRETTTLLRWMAFAAPMMSLRLSAGSILVSFGKPYQRIAFELLGITVLVVSMLALAPGYGLHGLAIAMMTAEGTMAIHGWWLVYRRVRTDIIA